MTTDSSSRRIDIWWVQLQGSLWESCLSWLSADEYERFRQFTVDVARRRFAMSRLALRGLMARLMMVHGRSIEIEQSCAGCSGPHGALRLPGSCTPSVSLSRSNDLAVIAIGHMDRLGVDVEYQKSDLDWESVTKDILSSGDRFAIRNDKSGSLGLRLWAQREAFGKAWEVGLMSTTSGVPTFTINGHLPLHHNVEGTEMVDISKHNLGAAVAYMSPNPSNVQIVHHERELDQVLAAANSFARVSTRSEDVRTAIHS